MSTNDAEKIAVVGAGSWGTALATLLARHGHTTVLWGRDAAVIEAIDQRHENPRYLPGIPLPESLRASTDLAATVAGADWILVVVPSHAFAETLRNAKLTAETMLHGRQNRVIGVTSALPGVMTPSL